MDPCNSAVLHMAEYPRRDTLAYRYIREFEHGRIARSADVPSATNQDQNAEVQDAPQTAHPPNLMDPWSLLVPSGSGRNGGIVLSVVVPISTYLNWYINFDTNRNCSWTHLRGNVSAPGIFCDPCPTGGLLPLICWATLYGFAPWPPGHQQMF